MEKKKKGRPPKTKRLQEEEVNNSSLEDGSDVNSGRRNSSDKMEKKRGRPHKQKRFQEQEFNNSSFACAAGTRASSPSSSLGYESASQDPPTVPSPRTRSALTLCSEKAAVSSQSRFPVQNIDGNSSQNSTLLLVKQILFESNTMDEANHVAAEAKVTHSGIERISPDEVAEAQKGIESRPSPMKNGLDLEKFTSDLLAQTQQPESPFQVASPCSDNLPEMEPNVVSANRTARADPVVIDVEGYKVKKETAPLLKAIFNKYGDIARESTFSMESRSCLLELVCSIYTRLEASRFMQLSPLELESMLGQIGDLRLVQVEVGWLHERLDTISKARQMYGGVSTLEDLKARSVGVIDEKQRAVKKCEEELQACMADAMKLQERLCLEKDELAAARAVADDIDICGGSLVRGLLEFEGIDAVFSGI